MWSISNLLMVHSINSFSESWEKRGIFEVWQIVHFLPIPLTLRQFAKKVHTIEQLKLYHYEEEGLVQLTQLILPSLA